MSIGGPAASRVATRRPDLFWLLTHVACGLTATVLGPLQFVASIRRARPAVHRAIGRVYCVAVVLAAIAALHLAVTSAVSAMYSIGLVIIASLWLGSISVAYQAARRRKFTTHRQWMLRNYTITFFFIIFFAVYDLLTLTDVASAEQIATVGVWVCWVIPLSLVEWWIRRSPIRAV